MSAGFFTRIAACWQLADDNGVKHAFLPLGASADSVLLCLCVSVAFLALWALVSVPMQDVALSHTNIDLSEAYRGV